MFTETISVLQNKRMAAFWEWGATSLEVMGDSRLSRHMVKGHLKTPNRTLPCNSVHQEMRVSTFDHPQSHETYPEHDPCASL